jgi:ribosomal protein L11 methyltransferase
VTWSSIRIEPGPDREAVLAALFGAGAQGVHEDGTALVTHFPQETDVAAVLAAVQAASPVATCVVGEAANTDWSVAWRDRITAHTLGRITVTPPWLAGGFDPAATVVVDPGMAFGTGDHPTTRGALRLLQQVIEPGMIVADLGAGSAVLAIAAAKLGARRVFAVEYDGEAIGNAMENVAANGVADRVEVFEGDAATFLPLVAPVDLITANIISSVLVELMPAMLAALRPGGHVVLAGILSEERSSMLEALSADGWRVVHEDTEEVWWSLTIATS